MRIIVFSDSHGNFRDVLSLVKERPDAGLFLFLGDGVREVEDVETLYPGIRFEMVSGNCDSYNLHPRYGELLFPAGKLFFCHGDVFGVKYSLEALKQEGEKRGAKIILFGHTHQPYLEQRGEMTVMNPGSLSRPRAGGPSYGQIDLSDTGFSCSLCSFVLPGRQ